MVIFACLHTRLLDLYYLANKLAECYFIMLADQNILFNLTEDCLLF